MTSIHWTKNSGPRLTEIDPLEKFDLVTQLSKDEILNSIESGNIAVENGGNPYSPDGRLGAGRVGYLKTNVYPPLTNEDYDTYNEPEIYIEYKKEPVGEMGYSGIVCRLFYTDANGQKVNEKFSRQGTTLASEDVGFTADEPTGRILTFTNGMVDLDTNEVDITDENKLYFEGDFEIRENGTLIKQGKYSVYRPSVDTDVGFLTSIDLFQYEEHGIHDQVQERVNRYLGRNMFKYLMDQGYSINSPYTAEHMTEALDLHIQRHSAVYARIAPVALAKELKRSRDIEPGNRATVDSWDIKAVNSYLRNNNEHVQVYSDMRDDLYRTIFWNDYLLPVNEVGDQMDTPLSQYKERGLGLAQQMYDHYQNSAVLFQMKEKAAVDFSIGSLRGIARVQSICTMIEMLQFPDRHPADQSNSLGDKLRGELLAAVFVETSKNVRITEDHLNKLQQPNMQAWLKYMVNNAKEYTRSNGTKGNTQSYKGLLTMGVINNGEIDISVIKNLLDVAKLTSIASEPVNGLYEFRAAGTILEKAGLTELEMQRASTGARFLVGAFCLGLLIYDLMDDGTADWSSWLDNTANIAHSSLDLADRLLAKPLGNALLKAAANNGENALLNRNYSNPASRMMSRIGKWFNPTSAVPVANRSATAASKVIQNSKLAQLFKLNSLTKVVSVLGVAVATIGVVVCIVGVMEAFKNGSATAQGFSITNLTIATAMLGAAIGFALGVSWMGPVGLFLAAVGLVLFLIQIFIGEESPQTQLVDKVDDFFRNKQYQLQTI